MPFPLGSSKEARLAPDSRTPPRPPRRRKSLRQPRHRAATLLITPSYSHHALLQDPAHLSADSDAPRLRVCYFSCSDRSGGKRKGRIKRAGPASASSPCHRGAEAKNDRRQARRPLLLFALPGTIQIHVLAAKPNRRRRLPRCPAPSQPHTPSTALGCIVAVRGGVVRDGRCAGRRFPTNVNITRGGHICFAVIIPRHRRRTVVLVRRAAANTGPLIRA